MWSAQINKTKKKFKTLSWSEMILRINIFLIFIYFCIVCSRKNFVFLFGALINLTVRVDTYFYPIRMTYPIHPGPFFRAAPNWGKAAKHSLPQNSSKRTEVLLSRNHEEGHLIYGPLESILLDQGFPVEYELDEFNTPHTGTTLSPLQLWLCRLRRKIPLRQPATSSLGNIFWRH